MFTRVDRGRTAPQRLDTFTAFMRDEVVPELRRIEGYRSTSVAIDRPTTTVTVTTTWQTKQARDQADGVLAAVLKNAGRFELVPIQIEFYELALTDVSGVNAKSDTQA